MAKDHRVFFGHMLESAEYIKKDLANIQKEEFLNNRQLQDIIIRRLEIIGEAASNVLEDIRKRYPLIPWRDIMDMRNKLIHEYFGVDAGVVWKVAKYDVLELEEQVEKILKLK